LVRIDRLSPRHVQALRDIVKYIAEREGISTKEANGRLLVDLRLYFNREKLRSDVLELEERMKVLRNFILYDFDKRFGMTTALELLDSIKQTVAKEYYNWDANLLSRDLKDSRQWREMQKQEQEGQQRPAAASSPQPASPSSPSTPQSQEEAVQSSPSQSDAKPSAEAEPANHENEEYEEESQEGGRQTDAEGDKETLA
jgi:hypothetical protein